MQPWHGSMMSIPKGSPEAKNMAPNDKQADGDVSQN
jgi:hypothetical protein